MTLDPWVDGPRGGFWHERDAPNDVRERQRRPPLSAARDDGSNAACPDLGTKMDLPPFGRVLRSARWCFQTDHGPLPLDRDGHETWPESDCEVPCVLMQETCPLPSAADAGTGFELRLLTRAECEGRCHAISGITATERDYVLASLGFLRINRDLVAWCTCLATDWQPDMNEKQRSRARDCLERHLDGGIAYLCGIHEDWDGNPDSDGPTGWATVLDGWDSAPSDAGVVVPIRHNNWGDGSSAWANRANDPTAALAAIVGMAWNLMHEILHLCGAPPELKDQQGLYWDGFASDHHRCWGIQNTAGNSFLWALSHRYPCLDGTGCSPRVRSAATPGALAFMNPESRADDNYDTHGVPASPNPYWSQNLPFPYRAGVLPC